MNKLKNIDVRKVGIIAIGVVILVGVYLVFFSNSAMMNRQEKKLTKKLTEVGKEFYENYYYPQTEKSTNDIKEYLESINENGIIVDLVNLSNYKKEVNKTEFIKYFVNKVKKTSCDAYNTKVIITPREPYGKKDYDIEVKLICEFDNLAELQLEASKKGIDDYLSMNYKELKKALKKNDK